MSYTSTIVAEQLNGGKEFTFRNQDLSSLTVDTLREMIAEKLHIPKNTIQLRLRKDVAKEQMSRMTWKDRLNHDKNEKVNKAYPDGVVKYDIKY